MPKIVNLEKKQVAHEAEGCVIQALGEFQRHGRIQPQLSDIITFHNYLT